jgi:hypothetical protein
MQHVTAEDFVRTPVIAVDQSGSIVLVRFGPFLTLSRIAATVGHVLGNTPFNPVSGL